VPNGAAAEKRNDKAKSAITAKVRLEFMRFEDGAKTGRK